MTNWKLSLLALAVLVTPALAERRHDCWNNSTIWVGGCVSEKAIRGSGYRGKSTNRTSNPDTPGTPNNPDPPGSPNTPDPPSNSNQGRNNGFGNGDQDPPGNSGPHNNAENSQHSDRGNSSNAPGHNR